MQISNSQPYIVNSYLSITRNASFDFEFTPMQDPAMESRPLESMQLGRQNLNEKSKMSRHTQELIGRTPDGTSVYIPYETSIQR